MLCGLVVGFCSQYSWYISYSLLTSTVYIYSLDILLDILSTFTAIFFLSMKEFSAFTSTSIVFIAKIWCFNGPGKG